MESSLTARFFFSPQTSHFQIIWQTGSKRTLNYLKFTTCNEKEQFSPFRTYLNKVIIYFHFYARIRKAAGTSEPPLTEEILQEIKVDDDELDSLQELKSMVSQSANKSSSKNTQNVLKETAITDDELDSLRELKDMFSKSDDRSLSNNAQSVLNKAPVAGWTELDCDLGGKWFLVRLLVIM